MRGSPGATTSPGSNGTSHSLSSAAMAILPGCSPTFLPSPRFEQQNAGPQRDVERISLAEHRDRHRVEALLVPSPRQPGAFRADDEGGRPVVVGLAVTAGRRRIGEVDAKPVTAQPRGRGRDVVELQYRGRQDGPAAGGVRG